MAKCTAKTEVYSRCVGYYAPQSRMNAGKQNEITERKMYDINSLNNSLSPQFGEFS